MANVTYFQLKDGKVFDERTYICFAPIVLNWHQPDSIRYITRYEITKEALSFYLDFLKQAFNGEMFKYELTQWKDNDAVLFELNTKGMDKHKALTYLTAFRYIYEYPHLVKQLYEESQKIKQLKSKFKKFMDIHKRNSVGDGHSLTYAYNPAVNLVGYDEFRKRIGGKIKIDSVHDYFSSKEPPKPEKVYNLKERELEYFWEDVKRI